MDATEREPETLDKLIGSWVVHQLRRGHRFSTDDLVTAWRAAKGRPRARTLLDLGCGIGSVGLSTLYHLPADAAMIGVEAQAVSVDLARRTIATNGLEDRVRIVHGDIRDPAVLPAGSTFELVTGSPPYVPLGTGLVSAHPQRAGARIELRGSVFDYCEAAARWLAPDGRFYFVMWADDPRTEEAPVRAGLVVVERWDVVFGRGRRPHIAVLGCARRGEEPPGPRVEGRLAVRGPDGEWTAEYEAFRREMGVVGLGTKGARNRSGGETAG